MLRTSAGSRQVVSHAEGCSEAADRSGAVFSKLCLVGGLTPRPEPSDATAARIRKAGATRNIVARPPQANCKQILKADASTVAATAVRARHHGGITLRHTS
jgi:hypothetical protein